MKSKFQSFIYSVRSRIAHFPGVFSLLRMLVLILPKNLKVNNYFGFKMYIDSRDLRSLKDAFLKPDYENKMYETFNHFLKPGMSVVDLGAHIGLFTIIAAQKVGGRGKVYSFEPMPRCFELLQKNVNLTSKENEQTLN